MKTNLINSIRATLMACLCALSTAVAAPYEKGQAVDSFQAKDQHDQPFTLAPAETRFLLVSHDMDTGKKANGVLTHEAARLAQTKVVFLANIHGMPAIGRAFAFPKMRKYAHRIIIGDDAGLIARFPTQQGKVTVLELKDGKVASIRYWTPGSEPLQEFLK